MWCITSIRLAQRKGAILVVFILSVMLVLVSTRNDEHDPSRCWVEVGGGWEVWHPLESAFFFASQSAGALFYAVVP